MRRICAVLRFNIWCKLWSALYWTLFWWPDCHGHWETLTTSYMQSSPLLPNSVRAGKHVFLVYDDFHRWDILRWLYCHSVGTWDRHRVGTGHSTCLLEKQQMGRKYSGECFGHELWTWPKRQKPQYSFIHIHLYPMYVKTLLRPGENMDSRTKFNVEATSFDD